MRVWDLFSGIGGFSLGLERAGMTTVAFCETDPFCRKVLNKHWPDVPIFGDITTLKGDEVDSVELICGGFPCQPFSVAGKQKGKEDDRYLWPEMFRIIKKAKPRWVVAENVTGIIGMVLDEVLFDLEGEGYETQSFIIPACGLNAPHRRNRVWIVAHSEHNGQFGPSVAGSLKKAIRRESSGENNPLNTKGTSTSSHVADNEKQINWENNTREVEGQTQQLREGTGKKFLANSEIKRIQRHGSSGEQKSYSHRQKRLSLRQNKRSSQSLWVPEPDVGRVANGIPSRVDRLKGLGNAVVPQIVEVLGKIIMEVENDN